MIEIDPGHWNDPRPAKEQPIAAMLTALPEPPSEPAVWIGEKVKCDTRTCGRVVTLEASDAHLVIVHRPMPWHTAAPRFSFFCPTCKMFTYFEPTRPKEPPSERPESADAESVQ